MFAMGFVYYKKSYDHSVPRCSLPSLLQYDHIYDFYKYIYRICSQRTDPTSLAPSLSLGQLEQEDRQQDLDRGILFPKLAPFLFTSL